MFFLIVYLFSAVVALGAGLLSGWSDFRGLTIPNLYPALIAGAFVPAAAAVHFSGMENFLSPLKWHLIAALVIFAVTFILFHLRLMGGGDSKLLTAYALWVAFIGLPPLLFFMAFLGAFVGIFAMVVQRRKPFKSPPEKSWIARLQAGENKVPYGIPITFGTIIAFVQLGYLDPENLKAFLQ